MMQNENRVVIVTGAGKGLGRAFALQIAADGGAVVVNNRIRDGQADSASKVVAEIEEAGGRAVADHHDIRDSDAPEALINLAISRFGRLDAVVFNAGVNGDPSRFENMPPEKFDEVLSINFFAPMRLAHAAWPHLEKARNGRMLFVSSTAGLYGVRGRAPYAASKGALNAFSATLGHEGRKAGIGVNILMPYAATQMTAGAGTEAMEKILAPENVAPLASMLISPDYEETGQTWIAGAGFACKAKQLETIGAKIREIVGSDLSSTRDNIETLPPHPDEIMGAEKAFEVFMARAVSQRQVAG